MSNYLLLLMSLLPLNATFSYDLSWEKVLQVRKITINDYNCHSKGRLAIINLNTADKTGLINLIGIGPKKAEAIIKHRMQFGSFKSAQELTKVKGFSKKMVQTILEKNKEILTLEDNE